MKRLTLFAVLLCAAVCPSLRAMGQAKSELICKPSDKHCEPGQFTIDVNRKKGRHSVVVCSVLEPGVTVGGGDNCDFHDQPDPVYCRYFKTEAGCADPSKLAYHCGTSFGCQNLDATEPKEVGDSYWQTNRDPVSPPYLSGPSCTLRDDGKWHLNDLAFTSAADCEEARNPAPKQKSLTLFCRLSDVAEQYIPGEFFAVRNDTVRNYYTGDEYYQCSEMGSAPTPPHDGPQMIQMCGHEAPWEVCWKLPPYTELVDTRPMINPHGRCTGADGMQCLMWEDGSNYATKPWDDACDMPHRQGTCPKDPPLPEPK